MGWCYSLLVSRVWFWGRCYAAAAAAGRHRARATTRTTLSVPHLPLNEKEKCTCLLARHTASLRAPAAMLPALPAPVCRPDCGPAYLRPVRANPTSPPGAAQRPHFFFFSSHIRALLELFFEGLKLYSHPLVRRRQGNYPRGRCDVYLWVLTSSFAAAPCACLIGSVRLSEAGATNGPGWVSFYGQKRLIYCGGDFFASGKRRFLVIVVVSNMKIAGWSF